MKKLLFALLFAPCLVSANLSTNVIKQCTINYSGDSCESEIILKTDEPSKCKFILEINITDNESTNLFDGKGIQGEIIINNVSERFSEWVDGQCYVDDKYINKQNNIKIKLNSLPNLESSLYEYNLRINCNTYDKNNQIVGGQYTYTSLYKKENTSTDNNIFIPAVNYTTNQKNTQTINQIEPENTNVPDKNNLFLSEKINNQPGQTNSINQTNNKNLENINLWILLVLLILIIISIILIKKLRKK